MEEIIFGSYDGENLARFRLLSQGINAIIMTIKSVIINRIVLEKANPLLPVDKLTFPFQDIVEFFTRMCSLLGELRPLRTPVSAQFHRGANTPAFPLSAPLNPKVLHRQR